jgi:streptogramin lyase
MGNHAVRKVDMQTGVIRTIAGTGLAGYSGDGDVATVACLKQPHSIQFGPDGCLYICDTGNHSIRKMDPKTGIISTFAGTGAPGNTPDGAPIDGTPLRGPRSLDFDAHGNLWLATREGNQIFKMDLKAGRIHLVAGTGAKGFSGNGGPAKAATFNGPKGIAVDAQDNVWIVDTENQAIRMINSKTGNVELICGTGEKGDGPDGDPLKCKLGRPHGIFADKDGSIYIGDSETHRIRVLKNK